jgi:hypothetical protein
VTRFAAHPTLYKGILFRSRLEARWAAYFDLRGWAWTYEPYDLMGYSPDFSVNIYPKGDVLVEVKPATKLGQLAAPVARIHRAGWKGPWMVVGADPDVCMEGQGRRKSVRRYLGQEAPIAWADACNITQWNPDKPTVCAKCGRQDHPLHHILCKV